MLCALQEVHEAAKRLDRTKELVALVMALPGRLSILKTSLIVKLAASIHLKGEERGFSCNVQGHRRVRYSKVPGCFRKARLEHACTKYRFLGPMPSLVLVIVGPPVLERGLRVPPQIGHRKGQVLCSVRPNNDKWISNGKATKELEIQVI